MNSDHSAFGIYFGGKRYHQEGREWSVYADRNDAEYFINKESEQMAYNDFQEVWRSMTLNGSMSEWNRKRLTYMDMRSENETHYLSKFAIIEFKPINNQWLDNN